MLKYIASREEDKEDNVRSYGVKFVGHMVSENIMTLVRNLMLFWQGMNLSYAALGLRRRTSSYKQTWKHF